MTNLNKSLFLGLIACNIIYSQRECPPCEIVANPNFEITLSNSKWPKIEQGKIIRINSLTDICYENDDIYWPLWKAFSPTVRDWWNDKDSDPWALTTDWNDNYITPAHNFKDCVNDELRWKCGYSYSLRIPENFDKAKNYPLVIFLHGSVNESSYSLTRRIKNIQDFYMAKADEYILASPIKIGIDWSPKKIQDLIEDVKANIKIDINRIYLTGLSMGGRGTFIVASKLENTFAAIMPLSPHHTPYSYLKFSAKVNHIPTFMHHSENDRTSSFKIAKKMYNELSKSNNNIIFDIKNWDHSGWNRIYQDKDKMEWLLSWSK